MIISNLVSLTYLNILPAICDCHQWLSPLIKRAFHTWVTRFFVRKPLFLSLHLLNFPEIEAKFFLTFV